MQVVTKVIHNRSTGETWLWFLVADENGKLTSNHWMELEAFKQAAAVNDRFASPV